MEQPRLPPMLAVGRIAAEFSTEPLPGPVQAGLHAADRDTGDGGDLLVGEALEVGEKDDRTVPVRQGSQRRGEIGTQPGSEQLVFG